MNDTGLRLLRSWLAVTLLSCVATHAVGSPQDARERRILPSVLELTASRDGVAITRGTAVAIDRKGWLITSAKLAEAGEQIAVTDRSIGAISATLVAIDQTADLALLHVGVKLHAAIIARQEPAAGGIVSAIAARDSTMAAFVAGALGQMHEAAGPALSHNALFGPRGYGGPLINECGEVVGLDRTDDNNVGGAFAPPQNYALAATIGQIEALAARNGVKIRKARSNCVSTLTVAEERARAAELRAAALHNSQIAIFKEKQAADAAAVAAQNEAKAAEAHQHRAQILAEQRRQAADIAKRANERTQHLSYWGAGIAALLLLIAVVSAYFLVSRQRARRRDAEAEAEAAHQEILKATTPPDGAHDLLLEGRAPDGETITIKIPALALGEAHGGAVIGRSPDASEFVINRQGISRKHMRLFVSNGALKVEDMNSTNGIILNGKRIIGASEVQPGDVFTLDDLLLKLSYRNPKKSTLGVLERA